MRSALPLQRPLLTLTLTLGVCVLFSLAVARAPVARAVSTTIVISQFQVQGDTPDAEFVELHNLSAAPFDLNGHRLVFRAPTGAADVALVAWNSTTLIPPGGFYLVTNTAGYDGADADASWESSDAGSFALTGGGLALRKGALNAGEILDSVGYGTATNAFVEGSPAGAPPPNESARRKANGCQDTDANAQDFESGPAAPRNSTTTIECTASSSPTPTPTQDPTLTDTPTATLIPSHTPSPTAGETATAIPTPTETNTPTFTPTLAAPPNTPTATPTATFPPPPAGYAPLDIVISEVAWSGTSANAVDEWLELYNNRDQDIDLTGWTIQDGDDVQITLAGTLPARGYFLLERSDDKTISDLAADQVYTGALDNAGETLVLRDVLSNVIDTANGDGGAWAAGTTSPRCSMERKNLTQPDESGNWATNDNVTRNGSDANGAPICGTPRRINSASLPPAPTMTPTRTPFWTPTASRTPAPGGLLVNEFLPNPERDWNGDGAVNAGDEWIELYNTNAFAIELGMWQLDDVEGGGSSPFILAPGTTIEGRGFLVIFGRDSGVALNNSNDDVRLLAPDGFVADVIAYNSSSPDRAWGRVPDAADFFSQDCPPTPGASNCSIAPTPTVTPVPYARIKLNEFLPAPYRDWNKDSALDANDEWIELYNPSNRIVDLSGWQLDDGKGGSSPYTLPPGTQIAPHDYLVFYASETHIGLNNSGDTVRLLHPDHTLADKKKYEPLETNRSYARAVDGRKKWTRACVPTPGKANCSNQPQPTPTPAYELTEIAAARELPEGSRVSLLGSVIARPCELDAYGHQLAISDGIAGIQVYLEYPERLPCTLARGEQIVVTGILRDHFGLRTIYPESHLRVTRHYAVPREIAPRAVHTGDLGEATESLLLVLEGRVSNGKNGNVLWVNDGTGIAEVYADPESGASFEGITRGSLVRITGLGYQYNATTLKESGYYLRPRVPGDVVILELAERQAQDSTRRSAADLGAVSIQAARGARSQDLVSISGVVSVPPGVIGARDFWVQDGSGGIHVYIAQSAGAPPELNLYDAVTVRGRVRSVFGARELRVDVPGAIKGLGRRELLVPLPVTTGRATFEIEGQLVTVQGSVLQVQGREIQVDDGSGTVRVYFDADTHIRYSPLHPGDAARITGIVSRFGDMLEILPRYQEDVAFDTRQFAAQANAPQGILQAQAQMGDDTSPDRHLGGTASGRAARPLATRAAPVRESARRVEWSSTASNLILPLLLMGVGAAGILGTIAVYGVRRIVRRG